MSRVFFFYNKHFRNVYRTCICVNVTGTKTITDKKKVKKEQWHTCSKNKVVENINTNSSKWKFCSYIEYRISFTTLSLQKLVKNCWIRVHKSSGWNDVIYGGIKDKSVFVLVERSVAEK